METLTRGHQALRRGRCSLPGQIYLITFVTLERKPFFADSEAASAAAAALHALDCRFASKLLCWVLMPDHWHGMLRLSEEARLDRHVLFMKSCMAKAANRSLRRAGPFWSRAFHDRALRRDEDLLGAARYIVANPLRAGLVAKIGDYPFWDSVWL